MGVVTEPDVATVIARLEEAGATLLALAALGHRARANLISPHLVQHALDGVRGGDGGAFVAPNAARISRMEEALGWLDLIPRHRGALRRIVAYRALVSPAKNSPVFSWRLISKRLGVDHRLVQRWHATAIAIIVAGLSERSASAAAVPPAAAAGKAARPAVADAARREVVNLAAVAAGPS